MSGVEYNTPRQSQQFPAYYTGKDVNATKGSRSAYSSDLVEGDVLILDPYAHDTGKYGLELAIPTTSFLHMRKYRVTNVPTGAERGGTVWVEAMNDACDLWCANGTAVGDMVAVQNGSPKLVVATVFAATNMATIKTMYAACGWAQAANSSGATALTRCSFGLFQPGV